MGRFLPVVFHTSPFALLPFVSCLLVTSSLYGAPRPHLTFAFCSDIHYGCNNGKALLAANLPSFRQQLDSCDFLAVGGDLTDNGTASEFEQLRQELLSLGKPLFTLPGNHDFPPKKAPDSGCYGRFFGNETGSYYAEFRGVGLLFLDLSDGVKVTVAVKDRTARWLKKTAARIPASQPIVVFTHFPLFPAVPKFAVQRAELLFSVLDKKNVVAYFSGHYHCWLQMARNGVPFYTAGTLLANRENRDGSDIHGFYRVTVDGGKVSAVCVPLTAAATRANGDTATVR